MSNTPPNSPPQPVAPEPHTPRGTAIGLPQHPGVGAQPGYPQPGAFVEPGYPVGPHVLHPEAQPVFQASYPQPGPLAGGTVQSPAFAPQPGFSPPAGGTVQSPAFTPQQPGQSPVPAASSAHAAQPGQSPVLPASSQAAPPVPSGSSGRGRPPAPPPKSFAPSRNPIVRLILWFSEPSMLKGIALGVILALIVGVAIRLAAMWYIASGLLLILFVCLFGVIIGHYAFESRRKKLQARGLDLLRDAGGELPGLSDEVVSLVWTRDRSRIPVMWERLQRIRPAVEEIFGLTIAAVFRMMAMSALFAVLGGAISFAVFLTSFMQVERMTEQNDLIQRQIKQTDAAMEFERQRQQVDIALSISERRQATLREILADIGGDRGKPCDDVPLSKLGTKKICLGEATARRLSTFLVQLRPYLPVEADALGNRLADHARSPEQEQLLRYLSISNIEVGGENLDFAGAHLAHADLHGTFLERIRLPGVEMQRALLHDAALDGADLAQAKLDFAVLSRARLTQANLGQASLRMANLAGADLTGANLAGADLAGAVLKGAVLQQAQLGKAKLHATILADANLTGADLTEADLTLADFEGAELPQVPKIRAAAFWWLGVYPADYAGKLGLAPDALARNKTALERARKDTNTLAAVVDELKAAAPNAPG